MTLASDRILDLRDKINSLEFCLDNNSLPTYIIVDRENVIEWLEIVGDRLMRKTSNFRGLLEVTNKDGLEIVVNNKITACMSLALKIEYVKEKLFNLDQVKVSQHVYDFIKDV